MTAYLPLSPHDGVTLTNAAPASRHAFPCSDTNPFITPQRAPAQVNSLYQRREPPDARLPLAQTATGSRASQCDACTVTNAYLRRQRSNATASASTTHGVGRSADVSAYAVATGSHHASSMPSASTNQVATITSTLRIYDMYDATPHAQTEQAHDAVTLCRLSKGTSDLMLTN